MVCHQPDIARKFSPKNYADPTHIRRVLDQRMAEFLKTQISAGPRTRRFLKACYWLWTIFMVYFRPISTQTPRSLPSLRPSKKIRNLQAVQAQPGILGLNSTILALLEPQPYYHAIEGERYLPRLEANRPESEPPLLQLQAHGDRKQVCHLQHLRTNFRIRRRCSQFDVLGTIKRCILMQYKCPMCDTLYYANDSRLWACCRRIRSVYPVHHNYAQGSFHLQKSSRTTWTCACARKRTKTIFLSR
jgi:hypothetical protein